MIDNDSSQLKKVRKAAETPSPIINLKIKKLQDLNLKKKKKRKETISDKNSIDDRSKGKIKFLLSLRKEDLISIKINS